MATKLSINICCAIIKTQKSFKNWDDNTLNNKKIELLEFVLKSLDKSTDILILPAGYLNSSNEEPNTIFKRIEKEIVELIIKYCPELNICFGIDGRGGDDQLSLSISKEGIVAIARKFHHNGDIIELAETPFSLEQGNPRHFDLNGRRSYLAVCYDVFGIAQTKLENIHNNDFIICTVHGFDSTNKGDVDFARKGLAGASKQWKIHSYASAVFAENRNPTNWPSGVEWKHGDKSVKKFKYDDIKLDKKRDIRIAEIGTLYLDYYEE